MLTLLWAALLQRVVLHSAKYLALQPSRNGQMSPSACHPEQFPVVETDTANCFTTSAALGKDFKTHPKESYFLSYWGLGLILAWNRGLFLIQCFSNGLFKIGKNCLPVLLVAFFFKLFVALAVLYCAGIKLLHNVKLLFWADTCTRRLILWYLFFSIYICGRVILASVFDNSVWIIWFQNIRTIEKVLWKVYSFKLLCF